MRMMIAAALALALSGAAHAETVYVRAGHLVDPESGTVATARVLRIEQGRISAILPDGAMPAGATVIDWSRYTVLPGLIDMHVHLADNDETSNPAEPLLHRQRPHIHRARRNRVRNPHPRNLFPHFGGR